MTIVSAKKRRYTKTICTPFQQHRQGQVRFRINLEEKVAKDLISNNLPAFGPIPLRFEHFFAPIRRGVTTFSTQYHGDLVSLRGNITARSTSSSVTFHLRLCNTYSSFKSHPVPLSARRSFCRHRYQTFSNVPGLIPRL